MGGAASAKVGVHGIEVQVRDPILDRGRTAECYHDHLVCVVRRDETCDVRNARTEEKSVSVRP